MQLQLSYILILSLLLFSCKKEEAEKPIAEQPQEKWAFIGNASFNQKGHFHEDRNGVISYRNGFHVYVFDATGKHVTYMEERVGTNIGAKSPFMKDGSFYVTSNTSQSDYIFLYARTGAVDFSRAHIMDIKKLDTVTGIYPEYSVYSIQPNFLFASTNNNALAFAYRTLRTTIRDERMVLIELYDGITVAEYVLPKDIPHYLYNAMTITGNGIVISGGLGSFSLDRFRQYRGFQNSFQVIPQITLFNDFIVKNANGFHTSSDGLTLKTRINGLPECTQILHSRDSFLFISSDIGYSTFNAITGQEVRRFDLQNEKMPVSMDSVYVVDYYSARNGISYLVTNRGIVVAK
jgi:hypothetical protein